MPRRDTLDGAFDRIARQHAESVAILEPGQKGIQFRQLDQQLRSIRQQLQDAGIRRKSRVLLVSPRGPSTAISLLGIACHAICIPVSPDTPNGALLKMIRDVDAETIVGSMDFPAAMMQLAVDTGVRTLKLSCESFAADESEASCDAATPSDIALMIRTSGSSGRPKLVPISHSQLVARAERTRRFLQLKPSDRCLNLMAFYYMHGINSGLLGPLLSGGSLIAPRLVDEETFFSSLQHDAPTWYTAGTTYHVNILQWLRRRQAIHRMRFVRTGSSTMPIEVLKEIEQHLGIPLIESYSSSEAGTMTSNPTNWSRIPGTVGKTLDDEIQVIDERGNSVETGQQGEVIFRGPGVISGYEVNPELTAEKFRNGWFHTGDLGFFDSDGSLHITGRLDDIINRGGEKISPVEVEAALWQHPAVSESIVFAIPHKTLQSDIAAAVVLHPEAKATREELREHLSRRLPASKVPAKILFTNARPLTAAGKPRRRDAAEFYGLNHQDTKENSSPIQWLNKARQRLYRWRTGMPPMQRSLLQIFRSTIDQPRLTIDDDFFQSGGDSISAMNVIKKVHREFDLEITLNYLMECPTARSLSEKLLWHQPSVSNLIAIKETGSQRAIFSVAGRFGYAVRMALIGRALSDDQPFYALQPPDMNWESVGLNTIEEFASFYIQQLRSIQPSGPYRLLGASFGGLVVYEMALQLQSAGQQVELLSMLDTYPASCRINGDLDISDATRTMRVVTDEGLQQKHTESVMQVAQTHFHARNQYVLKDRFHGRINFFICNGKGRQNHDRRKLWSHFADEVRYIPTPGLHGSYHVDPQFSAVTGQLNIILSGMEQCPPTRR